MSVLIVPPNEQDQSKQNATLRQLAEGRSNAVGLVTLTQSATTTSVTAVNCAQSSYPFMFPATANAAAEVGNGTMYVTVTNILNGSFTITHANNAQTNRVFYFICLG